MNKKILGAVLVVIILVAVIGSTTGWFGLTGKVTGPIEKKLRVGQPHIVEFGGERYEIFPKAINNDGNVELYARLLKSDVGETAIITPGGEAATLNLPEYGLLTIQISVVNTVSNSKYVTLTLA